MKLNEESEIEIEKDAFVLLYLRIFFVRVSIFFLAIAPG